MSYNSSITRSQTPSGIEKISQRPNRVPSLTSSRLLVLLALSLLLTFMPTGEGAANDPGAHAIEILYDQVKPRKTYLSRFDDGWSRFIPNVTVHSRNRNLTEFDIFGHQCNTCKGTRNRFSPCKECHGEPGGRFAADDANPRLSFNDIRQKITGNCYIHAAMSAIAYRDPEIIMETIKPVSEEEETEMMDEFRKLDEAIPWKNSGKDPAGNWPPANKSWTGRGTYPNQTHLWSVRLNIDGKYVYVIVDEYLPAKITDLINIGYRVEQSPPKLAPVCPLWPFLIEKAIAKYCSNPDYVKTTLGSTAETITMLTPYPSEYIRGGLLDNFRQLEKCYNEHKIMAVQMSGHAYAVLNMDGWGFTVWNPHGYAQEFGAGDFGWRNPPLFVIGHSENKFCWDTTVVKLHIPEGEFHLTASETTEIRIAMRGDTQRQLYTQDRKQKELKATITGTVNDTTSVICGDTRGNLHGSEFIAKGASFPLTNINELTLQLEVTKDNGKAPQDLVIYHKRGVDINVRGEYRSKLRCVLCHGVGVIMVRNLSSEQMKSLSGKNLGFGKRNLSKMWETLENCKSCNGNCKNCEKCNGNGKQDKDINCPMCSLEVRKNGQAEFYTEAYNAIVYKKRREVMLKIIDDDLKNKDIAVVNGFLVEKMPTMEEDLHMKEVLSPELYAKWIDERERRHHEMQELRITFKEDEKAMESSQRSVMESSCPDVDNYFLQE